LIRFQPDTRKKVSFVHIATYM